MYERLQLIDPDYSEIVHMNNKKRLVRALEIFEATGIPPSVHFSRQGIQESDTLPVFSFLLTLDRQTLISRIEKRTQEMFAQGWIDEVKLLLKQQDDLDEVFPALNSIGYQQIQSYLSGDISYNDMVEDIVIRTRQYARRQMQWFRKEPMDVSIVLDHLDRTILPEIIHDLYNHCQ